MESILVAVDDSPGARFVLAAGIEMALETGARLRLLRVVRPPPDLTPAEWAASPTQVIDGLIATAKRDLRELGALVPADMLEASTAQVGVAWDAICAHAREHDCALIVIGSPGQGFFERLVGTTAAKVVNHADRAVLVVPKTPRGIGRERGPAMNREQLTNDVKTEIAKGIDKLTTLRDEARLHLHLATLDAKQEWDETLDPRIDELQAKAAELGEASKAAVVDLVEKVEGFVAKLRGQGGATSAHP